MNPEQQNLGRSGKLSVVVVILFPEEYNIIHSIHTTFQQFHKCIPLAVAREALWLIELTTVFTIYKFWKYCASVPQVSDLILKTDNVHQL